jgi:hypothetical protein
MSVDLEFAGVSQVPEDFDVYLVDLSGGRYVDLRKENRYHLEPATAMTAIEVLVGKPERVRETAERSLPAAYALEQNYPNPFNPSTAIPVVVPGESRVILEIYNILGQKVKILYDGILASGRTTFEWDGKDAYGYQVSTGMYICRLSAAGDIHLSRKISLIR